MKTNLLSRSVCRLLVWCLALPLTAFAAESEPLEGFTEPYRTIDVSTAETGLIAGMLVREGENVKAGQPVAILDDDLQRSQLTLVRQQYEAKGRLQAATAELAMYKRRFEKLQELKRTLQAHQEEVERAKAEVAIAEGKVLAEEEENLLLRLQVERAKLQLDRRTITAPIDGAVIEVHRQVGEFVSAANPRVITIVELHPLRATFLVSRPHLAQIKPQQSIKVRMGEAATTVTGVVEFISEVTDAQSGLTTVKLRLENPQRTLRSGERCRLELP